MSETDQDTVSFGYENVSPEEKTRRVGQVFSSVARKYDIMNDAMSFGMHRGWKDRFVKRVKPQSGENILDMDPEERAVSGVFLAFQYPMEIPGVAGMTFLRTAVNSLRKKRGQDELKTPDFLRLVKEKGGELNIDAEMLKRPVNVGFSGGEKKRSEILQMAMLEPSLCVLDETDSGLDIDALKVVSDGVNALRSPDRSMLVITHYQRLLNYIVPDKVHVLAQGEIKASGDKDLALELEKSGYAAYVGKAA